MAGVWMSMTVQKTFAPVPQQGMVAQMPLEGWAAGSILQIDTKGGSVTWRHLIPTMTEHKGLLCFPRTLMPFDKIGGNRDGKLRHFCTSS